MGRAAAEDEDAEHHEHPPERQVASAHGEIDEDEWDRIVGQRDDRIRQCGMKPLVSKNPPSKLLIGVSMANAGTGP
jgi:hypothetical protein